MISLLPLLALVPLQGQPSAGTNRHVLVRHERAPELATELFGGGFDVLPAAVARDSLEVIVSPAELELLRGRGLAIEVLSIGRPFREIQRERQLRAVKEGLEAVPPGYPTLSQILAQMQAAAASHPAICKYVDLTVEYGAPVTWEGRHIYAVKISDNVDLEEDEPAFLQVDNHHAREIVTPVLGLYTIEQLTSQYGIDPDITQVVDDWEIWVNPVFNPDGYEYVYNHDNWWRKNRRNNGGGVYGVDLNRNYPFGWDASCGGSTTPSSETYRGPSPASEQETQTMILWSADRRWVKVQDNHSYGEHLRYSYGTCLYHPWESFFQSEASSLSQASGYGGWTQNSCCGGGEFGYQIHTYGSSAYLWETAPEFQPAYSSAQAEAVKVFGGTMAHLLRPIPISGHVTDSCSGLPVVAEISLPGVGFQHNEKHGSGGLHGRYHVFAPPGGYTLRFEAPGYATQEHPVTVANLSTAIVLDVQLDPAGQATIYCTAKVNSQFCTPAITYSGAASASSPQPFDIGAVNMLNNKNGVLFYGFEPYSLPFQGAYLCVKPPVKRTPVQNSGGNPPPPDCSGTYSFDFNAYIQSGADPLLVVGTSVYAGYWARDPADFSGFGTSLTDALAFTICP